MDPGANRLETVLYEAHDNLLRLRQETVAPHRNADGLCRLDVNAQFLVAAGSGGVVCNLALGIDRSINSALHCHVFAQTYLDDGLLQAEQTVLRPDAAEPGKRLGDGLLLPGALQQFVATETGFELRRWSHWLPETLAASRPMIVA